ncbi:MAG: hypothetical protein WA849_01965 [Candidatus Udaeobacter sp.]
MKKYNLTDRRSFCRASLYARLIRIPQIRIRLKKVSAGLLAASEHSDWLVTKILECEFIVYDALYPKCKRRVSRGLVAEVS